MIAAILTAAWLGFLTAVSPCPLATNVAAVGFLGRHAARPGRALLASSLYVLGRTAAYTGLAILLSFGIVAAVETSGVLARVIGVLVGPILIVAGAMMLGLLPAPSMGGTSNRLAERLGGRGDLIGALLLGLLFALSFCPSSAAIFFGGLLPLAAKSSLVVAVPIAFGVATGLPVLAFALLLAGGSNSVGRLFAGVQRVERWLRVATALGILGVGLYLTARVTLGWWSTPAA